MVEPLQERLMAELCKDCYWHRVEKVDKWLYYHYCEKDLLPVWNDDEECAECEEYWRCEDE